jgi:hypothetical protein
MGFLSGIGKVLGGIGKVAGVVGQVAGGVGKVANFLKNPLASLTGPIKSAVGGLLDKLPGGIGQMVKPFAEKFLDKGLAFLAKGPLGGLGFLAKAQPTIGKIADLAQKVGDLAGKVKAFSENPMGALNFQNIIAHSHAAKLLEQ